MEISTPILLFVYPIVISLYILNLIDNSDMDPLIYRIVVSGVALVSFADSLKSLSIDNFYTNFVENMPLANYGFAFVFIFIVTFAMAYLISKLRNY